MIKKTVVKTILDQIEKRSGLVTPKAVVDVARDVKSPIHDLFDWDDAIAGEKYRLWQARQLITEVRIKFMGKDTYAYFHAKVIIEKENVEGYFSTSKVLSDEELHNYVLKEAIRELKYWRMKYKEIVELKDLVDDDKLNGLDN